MKRSVWAMGSLVLQALSTFALLGLSGYLLIFVGEKAAYGARPAGCCADFCSSRIVFSDRLVWSLEAQTVGLVVGLHL